MRCLKLGRPLVPVGTTSVRVLESLYWLGVLSLEKNKALAGLGVAGGDGHLLDTEVPHLSQWAPYETRTRLGDARLPSNIDALTVRMYGVCVYVYIYIYTYTEAFAYIYLFIYIYIYIQDIDKTKTRQRHDIDTTLTRH